MIPVWALALGGVGLAAVVLGGGAKRGRLGPLKPALPGQPAPAPAPAPMTEEAFHTELVARIVRLTAAFDAGRVQLLSQPWAMSYALGLRDLGNTGAIRGEVSSAEAAFGDGASAAEAFGDYFDEQGRAALASFASFGHASLVASGSDYPAWAQQLRYVSGITDSKVARVKRNLARRILGESREVSALFHAW